MLDDEIRTSCRLTILLEDVHWTGVDIKIYCLSSWSRKVELKWEDLDLRVHLNSNLLLWP